MINVNDTVRVKVAGKFHGQEVKVLAVKHKKAKTAYNLDYIVTFCYT